MRFLQIASWNVQPVFEAGPSRDSQYAVYLADQIEIANVEIVVFQGVSLTYPSRTEDDSGNSIKGTTGDRRNSELDRVCHLLFEQLGQPWSYLILPNRDKSDRSDLCAVMWNKNKVVHTGMIKIPVSHVDGADQLWERSPHAIRFAMDINGVDPKSRGDRQKACAQHSISLVPLHMKGNCGDSERGYRIRAKEARALCNQLPMVREELDECLILVGDTGILDRNETAVRCFKEQGLIDLNNKDVVTKRWGEALTAPADRAFVAERCSVYLLAQQYVLNSSGPSNLNGSVTDHSMIKISLKLLQEAE